ncbi:MAG: T9SS type A sorting domain-containing protein [Candidatus Firestonebacteria bacterium]|nr:T9SS type A sorting domain-containing protein [Candidatus Firestonebacteria bacterium]
MKTLLILFVSVTLLNNVIKGQVFNNLYEQTNSMILPYPLKMDSCYILSSNVLGIENREFFIKLNKNGTLSQSREFTFPYIFYGGETPTLCKVTGNIFFYFHATQNGSILIAKMNTNLDTIWTEYYDGGDSFPNLIKSAYYDSTNNRIIAGGRTYPSLNNSNYWLLVLSAIDGTILKDTSFYILNDYYNTVYKIIPTNDHGYLLSGPQAGYWCILKLDSLLNKQWHKVYYRYGGDEVSLSVTQLPDSGYFLAGRFWHHQYQDDTYQAGIMRVDKNGNEMWRKRYGYIGPNSYFSDVFQSDGNFIAVGVTDSIYVHPASGYMLKINENGDELWHRYFYAGMFRELNNNIATIVTHTLQTDDGGFFLAGHFFDPDQSHTANLYTAFAIKTDANGCDGFGSCDTNLRIKALVTSYNTKDTVFQRDPYLQPSIVDSPTSTYIYNLDTLCTGERLFFEFTVLGGIDSMEYNIDIYCEDKSFPIPYPYGYKLKTSFYNVKKGTKYYYLSDPLEWVLYQGYVTGGGFKILGTYDYGPDLYNTVGVTIDTTCTVGINELLMDKDKINVYPNPTTSGLNIQLQSDEPIQAEAGIYNMLGELVVARTLKNELTQINVINLPEGFYTVKVKEKNGRVFSGWFVKQK